MPEPDNPRVGVIADTSLQRHLLAQAVKGQGYDLVVTGEPATLDRDWLNTRHPDVWLVDLSDETRYEHFLDELLEGEDVPILFGHGDAPPRNAPQYPKWERRLTAKLLELVGRPRLEENLEALETRGEPIRIPVPSEFRFPAPAGAPPERVWVLAASLGGPAAVKLFLDSLPAELPVAFVLAQHIDGNFLESLTTVLTRDNGFAAAIGFQGERLAHGKIVIAPVDYEICFSETGVIQSTGQPWEGPYAPSIDQVIQNVAERYGERSGTLVFSGMGNDGSIAGPQMKARGGRIWAQTAASCACSSQPDAIRETGCVEYSGTPQELALQLVEQIRQDIRAATMAAGSPVS